MNIIHKNKDITAAIDDDDEFDDMGFDDESESNEDEETVKDSDSPADSLDDMADTLDEINDSLEDFKEDNVDIEVDNNISDHYIAECEKCHGIFITAVTESDQKIERISGTCPLCDEDCDQYLKWIIRNVE